MRGRAYVAQTRNTKCAEGYGPLGDIHGCSPGESGLSWSRVSLVRASGLRPPRRELWRL
jgi:hypothetical protein